MRKSTYYLLATAAVLSLWVIACGPITGVISSERTPTATATSLPSRESTARAMRSLQDIQIPCSLLTEDPVKTGDEFDINDYFDVLTHLSLEPGYVLDYVYCYDFMGGEPAVYARAVDMPPYRTCSEYGESPQDSYLNHVQIDGTEEGFVEFVLLAVEGEHFYLSWHAGYQDTTIVLDRPGAEALLSSIEGFCGELPSNMRDDALTLSFEPKIEIDGDSVTVTVITFSKSRRFVRESYSIKRDFPHQMDYGSSEVLMPYRCPLVF